MSLQFFSDHCVPAEISDTLRATQEFYHGKLIVVEAHRVRIRQ